MPGPAAPNTVAPQPASARAAAPKKVGFVSLGCPKNLVDSEVMMGVLARHGCEITPRPEDADVLVVNTCGFIEAARRESVDAILEMAEFKKSGRAQRLVVAGCLVERYRYEIQAEIPEVDALVGTNDLEKILGACAIPDEKGAAEIPGRIALTAPAAAAAPAATVASAGALLPILQPAPPPPETPTAPYLYDELTPRLLSTPRHTAFIKIAEGCDHPCAFCVIPQFRGRFRSRRFESVVAEAERLARGGARELVLIGQDTTCYGEDLGLRHGLAHLLGRLAEIEAGELTWIRTLYFYPNKVTQALLDAIAAHHRLCKYVDMPLQHASASVLKRMKRGGGGDIFLKLLERIRRTIPGVSLRTTMIVGFPGETEADFDELCAFTRAAEFDWLGVFAYSDEETGAAFHLSGKVPRPVAEARRRKLMALQRQISRRKRRAQVGERRPALFEGQAEESDLLWRARWEGQAPEIDGKILINEFSADRLPPAGALGEVTITAAQDYDVIARWEN